MKKLGIFIILPIILMVATISASEVKNNNKPLKDEWNFNLRPVWEIDSAGEDSLANITRFQIHKNGNLYLFDRKHFKFFVYNPEGKFLFSFGKKGEGPGEMKFMINFGFIDNTLIVSDLGKIHYFDLDGSFKKSISLGQNMSITPLFFLDLDHFIHAPFPQGSSDPPSTIEIFDLGKKTSRILIDLEPGKKKEAKQRGGMVMIRLGGSEDLEQKSGFVVSRLGENILWGKSDQTLIHTMDMNGKEISTFSLSGRDRKPISKEFKQKMVSRMNIRIQGNIPADLKKRLLANYSDISTYFHRFIPAKNGLIYIYLSDRERETGQEIDIFSTDGQYLYHADIDQPDGFELKANGMEFAGDCLYMAVVDDEGEYRIIKFKINIPPAKI